MASEGRRARISRAIEKSATPVAGVKVRALKTGYYNEQRYREGDVFIHHDGAATWVERVSAATAEKVTTGQEVINEELENVRADRASSGEADDVI